MLKAEAVLAELKIWMNAYQDKLVKMYGEVGKIPQVIQIRMKTVLNELTMLILEKWTKGAQAPESHEDGPGLSRSAAPMITPAELQKQYLDGIKAIQLELQDRHFQILMPFLEEDLKAYKDVADAIRGVDRSLVNSLDDIVMAINMATQEFSKPRLSNEVHEGFSHLALVLDTKLEQIKKVINLLE